MLLNKIFIFEIVTKLRKSFFCSQNAHLLTMSVHSTAAADADWADS